MDEATKAATSARSASMAQAGRLLCVSETIYPHGPHHGMSLMYGGIPAVGGAGPQKHMRMAGEGLMDLHDLVPATLPRLAGEPAWRTSRRANGGGAGTQAEGDGRR